MELWTSFSVKEGVKPEKRGFQPMRKKLGEKFGVVFSFSVVVMGTELRIVGVMVRCRQRRYNVYTSHLAILLKLLRNDY